MKRTLLTSAALAALLALLVPGRLPAPEPVSPAEPARNGDSGDVAASQGAVAGQVVGPAGEPLPAVTVVLRGEGVVKVEVTGLDGTFQFTGLELGEYQVEAALGSDATSETVDLTATGFAGVRFILGGPISPGEPSGGDASEAGTGSGETPRSPGAAGKVAVVEGEFPDDLALQDALNAERTGGRELRAVVPLGPGKSLFVYQAREEPAPCTVLVDAGVEGHPPAGRLETRIRQQPTKTFVGVHLLASGAPALVFRDGR